MILTIGNSESSLSPLSIELYRELKELLSYTLNPQVNYYTGGYSSPKKTLLDKKGGFPTGLLVYVQEYLKKHQIKYIVKDQRIAPLRQEGLFDITLAHTPYPEQTAASEACFKHHRGVVSAPTGLGKSVIVSLIIQKLQVPTLVVVPSLELKRQLSETLEKAFGPKKVGKDRPIRVENIDSKSLKTIKHKYDCVIIDEFHHSGAKTYRKLNKTAWKDIYYRFGLTATPFRSQDNERLLLESVLSNVIYRISYQDSVNKGYIVPMDAYYYTLPKQKLEGSGTNWHGVYSTLVVHNEHRNKLIADLIIALKAEGQNVLCLVKQIDHGQILSELSKSQFANGEDGDSALLIDAFNKGKINALIGTTGVVGEGVDTKTAEYIIIAGLGKSKNAFHQQIGRGFRKNLCKQSCKIIIFLDKSHKYTLNHFKAQLKYLEEDFGVIAVELK